MKKLNKTEFESTFIKFSSWISHSFIELVCKKVYDQGGFTEIESDTNAEKGVWDGSLIIHFSSPPSAQEIVKFIKAAKRPDDFGMNDDKTLYLWYD